MSNYGYHTKEIPKGELGEFSKIQEEYEEFLDAIEQNNKIMAIVELCDLYGAIQKFKEKYGIDYYLDLTPFMSETYNPLMSMDSTMRLLKHDNSLANDRISYVETAIHYYAEYYKLTLQDIKIMSKATERAFASGRRT
jgi:hypothetical protein